MEPTPFESSYQPLPEVESANEKVIAHIRTRLLEKRKQKEDRARRDFEDDTSDLNTLMSLHPEIPITPPLPFSPVVDDREHVDVLRKNEFLNYSTGKTFGIRRGDSHFEYSYDPESNKMTLLQTREDLAGEYHYLGKRVVVAPAGGEASETDDLITLPPRPPGINEEDYISALYRDAHDTVRSYGHYFLETRDYFRSVHHFGGIPWKVKSKLVGRYTDLIFKNLHTKKIRRHIVRGNPSEYFMLQGEIFAVDESGSETRIIRCSTNKLVAKDYYGLFYDCGSYAVATVQNSRNLVFFVTTPLE